MHTRRFGRTRSTAFALLLAGWTACVSMPMHAAVLNRAVPEPPVRPAGDDRLAYFESSDAFRAWVRKRRMTRKSAYGQSAGVDEGDVVKLIGHHLVVLHEGRLFVVDVGGQETGDRLRLVHRTNVYRVASDDAWYDEMVVHDRFVFVSRYSYDDGESAIDVFSLGNTGRLRREARYRIRSSDYFSGSNYTLRLAGDRLLLYVPVPLDDYARGREDEVELPSLRIETRGRLARTLSLLPATRILKPSLDGEWLQLHVLITCSLSALPDVECRGEGVIGPDERELYVTAKHAYLWLSGAPQTHFRWREGCPQGAKPVDDTEPGRAARGVAYRFDIGGAATTAARTFGSPPDQFALRETADGLHALLKWPASVCGTASPWTIEHAPRLLHIPDAGFATTLRAPTMDDYRVLPGNDDVTVQLTEAFAVYANAQWARDGFSADAPAHAVSVTAKLYAAPFDRSAANTTLDIGHSVARLELVGHGAVAVGHPTAAGGLGISAIDLRATPRVSTAYEDLTREEAETRSHAFNALVDADGAGLFALPTDQSTRDWRAPGNTDLRFFRIDRDHSFVPVGALTGAEREPVLRCEVSCIDWYGNARAVFIGDRVFALVGYELVEGALVDGRIDERRRIGLDAPTSR